MKIILLDRATLGDLPSIDRFSTYGTFESFDTTSADQTAERIANAQVVITNKVVIGKVEMDAAPGLKLICVAATGTNNVDLDYAQSKGIVVRNVKGYSTESVAQQTFAMLFSLTNHVHYYHGQVSTGAYSRGKIFTNLDLPIFELKGKVFGIIGMGVIGQRVAALATAFGARVVYYSTTGKNQSQPYECLSLQALLSGADVVSIHAPLNEHTKGLLKYEQLSWMKETAYLINVGRGGIVLEDDLVQILLEEKIRGAALDVFAIEPLPLDSALLGIENADRLLLFPHTAWASVEARNTLVEGIHQNIQQFLKSI